MSEGGESLVIVCQDFRISDLRNVAVEVPIEQQEELQSAWKELPIHMAAVDRIIKCSDCGVRAVYIDHLYPYEVEYCLCERCHLVHGRMPKQAKGV